METTEYTKYAQLFEKVFQAYQKVESYLDLKDSFKSSFLEKKTWPDRLKSPEFPVAFLGSFNAGKSTIINAILGKNILPEVAKSATAVPTIVKKGDRDYAVIRYLGGKEKEELKTLYVQEIAQKGLGKGERETAELLKLDNATLLATLKQSIEEIIMVSRTMFSKDRLWKELKLLIDRWDTLTGESREISIGELSRYVVESKDTLFIDRAEVYLADANFSEEGIVLVDLPGLGVVNPRHEKITKSYVENDAKAFVITTVGLRLLEGDELEFLSKIHRQRPEVLQRAFWVINQWDTITSDQQRNQIRKNFDDKVHSYGFNITRSRRFEVAALPYLMVKLIEQGQFQGSGLDGHIKVLEFVGNPQTPEQAREAMKRREIGEFAQFKHDLFEYLEKTAKREFLEEARKECEKLARTLQDKLSPLYQPGGKETLKAREAAKKADAALENLNNIVNNTVDNVRNVVSSTQNLVFWGDKQKDLEHQIKELVQDMDRRTLLNEMRKGGNLIAIRGRLPQSVESRLSIADQFKEKVLSLTKENFVSGFSQRLLDDLRASNSLPEEIIKLLVDKLSDRDIVSRINGLCDVLLLNYDDTLEKYYSSCAESIDKLRNENKSQEDTVEEALRLYQDQMIAFMQTLTPKINEYFKMSVKNYFEELQKDLLALFSKPDNKFDIQKFVEKKVTSNLEGELGAELRKQEAIQEAYETLTEVRLNCQS